MKNTMNDMEKEMSYKMHMIENISQHWYYEDGQLEAMSEDEVKEIYNRLIDWLEP